MSISPHPELPSFDYVKPASLKEASLFLVEHAGEARPLSGGTDIFVRMRDDHWHDKYLVDVKSLEGMREISFDKQDGLVIGAGVSMNQVIKNPDVVENYPLLAEAARSVASYQLRTRATIVGNICNASPAGDTIGACLAMGGVLRVYSQESIHKLPLTDFFTGPGRNQLKPGEIVTGIELPVPPAGHSGKYIKLGRNQLSDLSIVGVTVYGYPDAGTVSGYRFHLALASVAPVPFVPRKAEACLADNPITPEIIEQAADLAQQECSPIDDVRGSSRYRKAMVKNLTFKGLWVVWEKLGHKAN